MTEVHIMYLQSKSMAWFLYDKDLCHERVKVMDMVFMEQTFFQHVLVEPFFGRFLHTFFYKINSTVVIRYSV